MTLVLATLAEWLTSASLTAFIEDAALQGRWGSAAAAADRISTLARRVDAEDEAARQLAFRGHPLVTDTADLPGAWSQMIGRVVTIESDDLGYGTGIDVFLLSAEDDRAKSTSRVTMLRRL